MADQLHDEYSNLALGIEFGSTRIKACAIRRDGTVVATGGYDWENRLVDGHWSYSLDHVWEGLRSAYQHLVSALVKRYHRPPTTFGALGISAMMHGYLAFDDRDQLLTPFRTWRDTYTGRAAEKLTEAFGVNIPLRWSISHYYQALLDHEAHVSDVSSFMTLAAYVHWRLTGRRVVGIGDAVGMFPVDPHTRDYDATMLSTFDALASKEGATRPIRSLLPDIACAGQDAGHLTDEGARLLDPTGTLQPGIMMCPAEGDAGTGMVATNAVRPRTGNVSVGTSIFAMIVLEHGLSQIHREVDPVTTPAGDPVAMVHCNNGASEIAAWVDLFGEAIRAATGTDIPQGRVYDALLETALEAPADAAGVMSYNTLSGEPVLGLEEGRPLVARSPQSSFTLSTFMRSQIYAAFAALAFGMKALEKEEVHVDVLYGHGGLFRTPVVAQRLLAAALHTPVGIAPAASEGGAWGAALLAAYAAHENAENSEHMSLADYLDQVIFAHAAPSILSPQKDDTEGFDAYLLRYQAGIEVQKAAISAWPLHE